MILWILLVTSQLLICTDSLATQEPLNIEAIARELFDVHQSFCWRRTYGRGVGYPLNACPPGSPDKSGLLCYPRCRVGYVGVGPACLQDCGNLKTFGIFCVGASISLRSFFSHVTLLNRLFSSDSTSQENHENSYKAIFVRDRYGRGAGSPMICSSEYEQNGALCYKRCDKRYVGVGPVCWQSCSIYQSVACGAGCATTTLNCALTIFNMAISIMSILCEILGPLLVENATANIIASATKNDWPLVSNYILRLSEQLTEKVLPSLLQKFIHWPQDMIVSTTKNTSVLLTVSAFNNTESLAPFIRLFHLEDIIAAFNLGLCDLPDELAH